MLTKTYFRLENIAELPLVSCQQVKCWTETYFDFSDRTLMKHKYWLRYRAGGWCLKILQPKNSTVDDVVYVLTYEMIMEIERIRGLIGTSVPNVKLIPDSQFIFQGLKSYASLI